MFAKRQGKEQGSAQAASAAAGPRRWWQWLLVYPTVAVAVIGALPTGIEAARSFNLGVPFGQSADARTQNRLWQENFECPQKANFNTTVNSKKVEIGSAVCESGDVLLFGKRIEWDRPQYRWVSWNEVAPTGKSTANSVAWLGLVSEARAAEPERIVLAQAAPRAGDSSRLMMAQTESRVICQRWVANGQLLQRVATPNTCYDQVINTFNGWVVSKHTAPCNRSC